MTGSENGPVHVTAELLAAKAVGAFHHLSLVAPGVGERSRPGSFLAVSVGEGHLARRSFWIHRVGPMGGHRAVVEIVVEPRGAGSRALTRLPVGAEVAVTGPLGRPFALPREPATCLLVGEGSPRARSRLSPNGCASAAAASGLFSAVSTTPTCSSRWPPGGASVRSRSPSVT